jgi:ubiquinone biosynthesis protein
VLTLERVRGIKIDNFAALDAAGIDRCVVAARGADAVLKMIFRDGFYHADPHPGNFFIEPGGRINVVDFGMVGTVDERSREQLVWALIAFASDDPERQVDTLFELGVARKRVDRANLQRDVEHLRARYYGRPVGEIEIRPVLRDVLSFVRTHRLQLPLGFALMVKTVVMHENLVTQLDPSFDFTAVLVPYARRLMMRHYSPLAWARWAGQAAVDAARLATELPQQARRLVAALERGDLELAVRPSGFDPVLRRIERIANRVVLGIVAASFVIALAVLLAAYHVRPEQGVVSILLLGFIGAVALGAYVAWSILRSGRP